MKTTSQTTHCIACGGTDVSLDAMSFMEEQAQFPICKSCAPFLARALGDPSFGEAYMRFLGVTDFRNAHQKGGAFSMAGPDSAFPEGLAERMDDFDLWCTFIGQRIRALRGIESDAS